MFIRNKLLRGFVITLIVMLVLSSIAFADPYMNQDYFQPEKVKEVFEVLDVEFNTPGFTKEKKDFTSHEEMMKYIYELQSKSDNMKVRIIGESQEGRPIPLIVFSNPSYVKPADILRLDKPIVWLQGQQHGNEPASGEAMLVMAEKLATGELGKNVLDKITVIIAPRCNADGSYYFQRKTAKNIDINRDHLKMELPETMAIHKVYNEYRPEIVVDAHEYGAGNAEDKLVPYYDMLVLSAKNLNIPKEVRDLSNNLFIENVEKSLDKENFSHFWYFFFSGKEKHAKIKEGGTVTRIGRNAFGLQPALSFLVESRGIGIGRENLKRRVMGHVITHTSIIKTAANKASLIKSTINKARAEVTKNGSSVSEDDKIVVTMSREKIPNTNIKMISQNSGEVVDVTVEAYRSSTAIPKLKRVRPYAYIMPPAYHDVAQKLANSGVVVRKLSQPTTLEVESYKVTDKEVSTSYYEGHFRNYVTTEIINKKMDFPSGSYIYYMSQPTANLISMALEPEADSGFVTYNILPVDINNEVPVYRLMKKADVASYIIE